LITDMKPRPVILISLTIVIVLAGVGYLSRRWYINERLTESQRLAQEEADRIIDPVETNIMDMTMNSELEEEGMAPSNNQIVNKEMIQSEQVFTPQIFSGTWQSHRDYISSGSVTATEVNDGFIIQFSNDYTFSGAPDPFLYLSSDNSKTLNNVLLLGALQSNNGAQAYKVSKEEFAQYGGSIYIWCRAFDLYMGQAVFVEQ